MTLRAVRNITQRWIIEGELELLTPTSLSNGDADPLVDLPIVVDPLEGRALLTGASLAGALRSYVGDFDPEYATALFGGRRGDSTGAQSAFIVEDALGGRPDLELRDGVSIDPKTRTAQDKEKYDRQLLAAGTTFGLGFELVLTAQQVTGAAPVALALALRGLQEGHIRLGGRKRRGFGECRVRRWRAWAYTLTEADDLHRWLEHGRRGSWTQTAWTGEDILAWPQLQRLSLPKTRAESFSLEARM
jgi:CRISPR/Cas system CSM-associated protein Csm3 (group 7 of RAMP superfamily)